MGLLTKEQILKAADLKTEIVAVSEWGGEVKVSAMSGKERDAFETSMFTGEGKHRKMDMSNLRARLVAQCIVDDDGKRVFDDKDIDALGEKSAAALDRVYAVAQRLNAMGARHRANRKKLKARPERLFYFRLALALGYPHPDYLLQDLSSRQVSEWIAYFSIEPFGEERADRRAGIIASTVANVNRGKDTKPFRAEDFMPYAEREPRIVNSSNLSEALKAAFKKDQ